MALVTITREQLLKMNDQFGQKKLKELFAKRDNAAKVNGEGSETKQRAFGYRACNRRK